MRINEQNRKTITLLTMYFIEQRARRGRIPKPPSMSGYLKDAREVIKDFPVFTAIDDIKASGGLNYALLRKDYGRDQIRELMKLRPGIVSKTGKAKLDEIAADTGFEDGDKLLNAIIDTPSKKAIIRDIAKDLIARQENDEWRNLGFEPTDGIYIESLALGDQVFMDGLYYTFCGCGEDGLAVLASSEGTIKVNGENKLPCDGVKRRGKGEL